MRFASTRDPGHSASLSAAILAGIAPDGGLYVPERFPTLGPADFDGLDDIAAVAERLLRPFFDDDALAADLADICREALDFPIPLRHLREGTAVLELFHGPTAAFKDVGARFLARSLARLPVRTDRPRTVLVATSGDTGGAVAAAFHGQPGTEVVVLFPKGRISARQEKQLTGWGGNVRALAVRGDFDDCQRLAKAAFADPSLRDARDLTSANSINLGRLLPQMSYYADASIRYRRERGVAPGFVIPTGNVGNAVACLWARESGLPIGEVVLATNANDVIPEYLETGEWRPRPTTATLANAMDVGNPSNMERLFALCPDAESARRAVRALAVDDAAIRDRIRRGPAEWGETWDPHTAAAVDVRERIGGDDRVIVATAHPAKFEDIVEPLIGREVPVPPALAALLDRPSRVTEIEPTLDALRAALGTTNYELRITNYERRPRR
jgi:threonine synthase